MRGEEEEDEVCRGMGDVILPSDPQPLEAKRG